MTFCGGAWPRVRELAALQGSVLDVIADEQSVAVLFAREGAEGAAPPEPPARAPGGRLVLGRYRLERKLGAGGFGVVDGPSGNRVIHVSTHTRRRGVAERGGRSTRYR